MVISAILVVAPIAVEPQVQYFYALLFIFAGLIFYVPFVYYKKMVPGIGMTFLLYKLGSFFTILLFYTGPFTIFLQKLLKIAPTTIH